MMGGGGGLGGLAGAIAAAQAARNAGNSLHSALGMGKQPGASQAGPGGKAAGGALGGGGGMSAREMLGHANKARIAGNQIHSALGLRDPPTSQTQSHGGAPPPPPPPPPPGGHPGANNPGIGGVDFAELRRGVGGMLGVGKSVGTPMLRNAGERAGGQCARIQSMQGEVGG